MIQYAVPSRLCRRRRWNTGSPAFAGDDGGLRAHQSGASQE